jgi:hypothetical protein
MLACCHCVMRGNVKCYSCYGIIFYVVPPFLPPVLKVKTAFCSSQVPVSQNAVSWTIFDRFEHVDLETSASGG